MPNTLAHFGAQGLVTRTVIRKADPRWVFLACVIPDVPWILLRAVDATPWEPDPYTLRFYAIAQASLLASFLLCAAFAALAVRPWRVLAVLALGSVLHLVLDALQTKWGNGVHLFAPFSWTLWNQGLFWPEHPVTHGLTAFGLVYALAFWLRGRASGSRLDLLALDPRRWALAFTFLSLYALVPFAMLGGPAAADNHSLSTLEDREARSGRFVEFDRNRLLIGSNGDPVLRISTGEVLHLEGNVPSRSAVVSVQGWFVDRETVRIERIHDHTGWPRDQASYVGLLILVLIWAAPIRRGSRRSVGRNVERGEAE